MHGGERAKKITFWHHPDLLPQHLSLLCDGKHKHRPWGVTPKGAFHTAKERNYPTLLCKRLAAVATKLFVKRARVETKPPKQCATSTSVLEPPSAFSRVLRHIEPRRGQGMPKPRFHCMLKSQGRGVASAFDLPVSRDYVVVAPQVLPSFCPNFTTRRL